MNPAGAAPRMLVLGANGLLGFALAREAASRFRVTGTIRGGDADTLRARLPEQAEIVAGVDAATRTTWVSALEMSEPDVVVNCIGAVKQRRAGRDPVAAITVNSLFPHELAAVCEAHAVRLVHVSTDCVFSGTRGGYAEDDPPDPPDLYGRSKLIGEPQGAGVLVLRTSFVGRELAPRPTGLVEWLIAQDGGSVEGFRKAIFSGITASEMARVIIRCAAEGPDAGLFHVAGEPTSKYELLLAIRDALGLRIEVEPEETTEIDRSLDGSRLRAALGWQAPPWPEMLAEMAADPTSYPSRIAGVGG